MIPESVTQEAIGMLIDLAEQGEIDPWDVNVIDVVDRFLSRLITDDRQGLFDSGQALLYASMLVLLKANSLSTKAEELAETDPNLIPIEEETVSWLPSDLEHHLRRRTTAPPPPSRRITLQELITQLQSLSNQIQQEPPRKRPRTNSGRQSQKAALQAITQLAHKENLTEMASALENYFLQHPIDLDIQELATVFNDKVGVFWGLLLLSAQSKVSLYQEEFYGNIQVRTYAIEGDLR